MYRLLVPFLVLAAAPADGWKKYDERRGATFEQRDVAGSSYQEFRASIEVPVALESAAAAIWQSATDPASTKEVRKEVLRQAADEVVVYQQVNVHAVSNRDMTLRLWRTTPAADGSREVRWETSDSLGPAPAKGYVRMAAARGGWSIKPTGEGKVRLVFVTYSDPGGSVPPVFVRGPQRDRAALDFWNVVDRLLPKK